MGRLKESIREYIISTIVAVVALALLVLFCYVLYKGGERGPTKIPTHEVRYVTLHDKLTNEKYRIIPYRFNLWIEDLNSGNIERIQRAKHDMALCGLRYEKWVKFVKEHKPIDILR